MLCYVKTNVHILQFYENVQRTPHIQTTHHVELQCSCSLMSNMASLVSLRASSNARLPPTPVYQGAFCGPCLVAYSLSVRQDVYSHVIMYYHRNSSEAKIKKAFDLLLDLYRHSPYVSVLERVKNM